VPTDYNDSHPSLADRLKRIGYWNGTGLPTIPPPPNKSAADHFLGTRLSGYLKMFEDRWNATIAANWKANFEQFKAARARVEELETKGDELSVEELLEKAGLIAQQKGTEEALPLLRAAYDREPDNPESNYTLGAVLLQNDDPSGMDLLRRAIELDPQWKYAASDVAFQYLRSKGQFEEAKEFAEVLDSQAEEFERARQEREQLYEGDRFSPHSFDEETVKAIVQKVRYYDEVTALYLVKKDVRYMEHVPFHVLFIDKRKAPRLALSGTKDMKTNELLDAISSRLESFDIGFFAVFDGTLAHFKPTVEAVSNAQIYLRSEE
jgi:tetratricopeptide (TPR) repeat protein